MAIPANSVFQRLQALATCLCSQIADPANGVPGVCFCGIVPGEQAAAAYGGDCDSACGMAWVKLNNIYPMKSIGAVDNSVGNCGSGLGFEIQMGIMRCISVGDESGNPLSDAELLEATELQIADALIMHKAVACCASGTWNTHDFIIGPYVPLGPEGGLVGGIITVQMGV